MVHTLFVDECGSTVTSEITREGDLLLRITHHGQHEDEGSFVFLNKKYAEVLSRHFARFAEEVY